MESIPYRLPLVIGATGHHDLRDEDIPELKRAVAGVIERLKHDYLHGGSETPIIVLSSLAEGADQLVAQVALDHGAKLIAPLPIPADEYRLDFEPALRRGAAMEFNDLLAQAVAAPVVRFAAGNTPENVREESRRALQYREVGIFIVRHCHVLIALWNGSEGDAAVGGTAEVVRFKREGIPLEVTEGSRAALDAPEIGPVIYVDTPRAKAQGGATRVAVHPWGRDVVARHRGGRLRKSWRYVAGLFAGLLGVKPRSDQETPELRAWETFAVQSAMTRQFNHEASELERTDHSRGRLDMSLRYLFDNPTDWASSDQARIYAEKVVPRWCAMYAVADALGIGSQKRVLLDRQALFLCNFFAVIAFETVAHVFPQLSFLLASYAAITFCALLYIIWTEFSWHQRSYLSYRALAEALRVAVFWKLLGIGVRLGEKELSLTDLRSTESIADAYPIRQPRELGWVKACLASLELLEDDRTPHLEYRPEMEGYASARGWVNGQLRFFAVRGPYHHRRGEILENRSFAFLALSALLALTLFSLERYCHWDHLELKHGLLVFLVGLTAGAAAILEGYSEKLALGPMARQYDYMRALFERASSLLPEQIGPHEFRQAQALFAELGAEALRENAESFKMFLRRPIRPP